MTAYEIGWIAAECGSAIHNCPYNRYSSGAIAWRNGFLAMYASVGRSL